MRKTDQIDIGIIDLDNVQQILAYRSYFENNSNSFYSVSKSNAAQPYIFDQEVMDFIKELYQINVMQPFNWVSWRDSLEAQTYLSNPNRITNAPLEVLVKMLIHYVRAERFISGHLVSAIEDGFISAILKRLDELAKDNLLSSQEVSPISL